MINAALLRDISLIWSLFHVLIMFISLYEPRYSKRNTILLTIVFMGSLVALLAVLLFTKGAFWLGKVLLPICTLPSLLFFYIMSKQRDGRLVFTFCLVDTAVSRLPEEERVIRCKCIQYPQLMFRVSNPYAGTVKFDENNQPVTDSLNHGVGTRSIAAYCKKYGAFCQYRAENGWFTLQIIQP